MRKIERLTLFLLALFQFADIFAEPMTVSFLNRPPYYFVEQNRATGMLVNRARQIFDKAGITVNFIQRPPKRIMRGIKHPKNEYCSIGWFKNAEREVFAKFSDPIYQNLPIVVLINKDNQDAFAGYDLLQDIFDNKDFKFGSIEDFSYGTEIDRMVSINFPSAYKISGEQRQLVRLLSMRRISYMLIAPEEIDTLITSASLNPDDFLSIELKDVPMGNKRHLMCNQHVSDEVMSRINIAIGTVIGSIPPSSLIPRKGN